MYDCVLENKGTDARIFFVKLLCAYMYINMWRICTCICGMCDVMSEDKETVTTANFCGICSVCVHVYVNTNMIYMYVWYVLLRVRAQRNRGRGYFLRNMQGVCAYICIYIYDVYEYVCAIYITTCWSAKKQRLWPFQSGYTDLVWSLL